MFSSENIAKWANSLLHLTTGVATFINPIFKLKMLPPWLPFHKELSYLSGAISIGLGIMV